MDQDQLRRDAALAGERLRRLQALADELAAALRIDEVARVVAAAGIAAIGADAAAIWCVDGDVARLLGSDDPNYTAFTWIRLDVLTPVTQVITSGQPVWCEARAEYAESFPVLAALTSHSAVMAQALCVVPLASPRSVHGAFGLTFGRPRTFDPAERDFLLSLGRHAAIAYERAQLYEDLERRRRSAESTAQRLEKLREATAALSRSRTAREVGQTTVRVGCEALGASAGTMWLTQPDGSLQLAASHGLPSGYLEQWQMIGAHDEAMPALHVVKTGAAMWIEDASDFASYAPEIYPSAKAAGRVWPFNVIPLTSGGRPIGVVSFSYAAPAHRFADDEREFVYGLAHSCEQALERTRLLEVEAAARKTAEAANQRKDEFLAMLGHELRNPLAAMVAAVDLVKLRDGALNRELGVIDRNLTHLTHLVEELLDVSRITLGKIRLERVAFDVARAVEDAIEAVRPTLDVSHHFLRVDVPEGLVVDADRDRFSQVLVNLLSNAIQYTPPGGQIELIASHDREVAKIVIKDTGVGISSDLMPIVFDAFVQGPRTIDRRQGGLGIGLTVVKRLVEMHGGTVTVQSEGESSGTTVTVRWPKASRQTATAKVPALANQQQMNVMIVDHNIEAAVGFGKALEEMGHRVVVAHDADEALQAGAGFAADMIFLEIALPGRDGYELAAQLRALPSMQNARIVAVGDAHDHERGQQVGIALHVPKPVQLAMLASLLAPN